MFERWINYFPIRLSDYLPKYQLCAIWRCPLAKDRITVMSQLQNYNSSIYPLINKIKTGYHHQNLHPEQVFAPLSLAAVELLVPQQAHLLAVADYP